MPITLGHLRRYAVARSLFKPTTLRRAIDRLGFVQADPIRAPARAQDLTLRHRVAGYRAGDLERRYPRLSLEEDFFVNYGFLPRALHELMHPRVPWSAWSSAREREARALLEFVGNAALRTRAPSTRILRTVRSRIGSAAPRTRPRACSMRCIIEDCCGSRAATAESGCTPLRESDSPAPGRFGRGRSYRRAGRCDRANLCAVAGEQPGPPIEPAARRRAAVGEASGGGARAGAAASRPCARRGHRLVLARGGDVRHRPAGGPSEAVRLLTPFDPVVWDRRRFEIFWDWRYRFEAYTPAAKRKFGYYALPLLWHERVIGWGNLTIAGGR